MRPLARQFLERGLIADASRERFDAAVASTLRLRNSVTAEVVLIVFVYAVGVLYISAELIALHMSAWYRRPATPRRALTPPARRSSASACRSSTSCGAAGTTGSSSGSASSAASRSSSGWSTHPGQRPGPRFLAGPVVAASRRSLMAHGAPSRGISPTGSSSRAERVPGLRGRDRHRFPCLLIFVLGPLLCSCPGSPQARRVGLPGVRLLAQRFVREFDEKWLRGAPRATRRSSGRGHPVPRRPREQLPAWSSRLRVVPSAGSHRSSSRSRSQLLPMAPLLLTMVPLEDLPQAAPVRARCCPDDALVFHRLQFAFTIIYHYLFPQLTMGLALLIVVMKALRPRGGRGALERRGPLLDPDLRHQLRGRRRHGHPDGVPVRHQLGAVQPLRGRRDRADPRDGGALRLLPRVELPVAPGLGRAAALAVGHFLAAVALFVGSWVSGCFIIATNAFMQHPVGHAVAADGTLRLVDFRPSC